MNKIQEFVQMKMDDISPMLCKTPSLAQILNWINYPYSIFNNINKNNNEILIVSNDTRFIWKLLKKGIFDAHFEDQSEKTQLEIAKLLGYKESEVKA